MIETYGDIVVTNEETQANATVCRMIESADADNEIVRQRNGFFFADRTIKTTISLSKIAVDLDRFIGYAYVAEHEGDISADDARRILDQAKKCDPASAERILVKGNAIMTKEAAEVFAAANIKLFGNESQTVGPEDSPMEVHLIMLGAQIVLLEGIRLVAVPEGAYILNAAPLNLGGADGSPCRATLMKIDE